jgi:hypothetical protein
MFRTVLVAVVILLAIIPASGDTAAPFGLRWGMSRAEFQTVGGKLISESTNSLGVQALVGNVPKALSDTLTVILLFGNDDKLWRVYTESKRWTNDRSGISVRTRFDELRGLLSVRYGKPTDYLLEPQDKYYRPYEKFAYSISQDYRTHAAIWDMSDVSIELVVKAQYEDTYYSLSYEYKPLAGPARSQQTTKDKEAL